MRRYMTISVLLVFFANTTIRAEDHEEADQAKQKEAINQTGREQEKARVFCGTFEFELEQRDGPAITIEGKTSPGRKTVRTSSTLEILDNQNFVWPWPKRIESRDADGHGCSEDYGFEMKIKSVGKNLVLLEVTAKQSRSEKSETDSSRSWNLSLKGSKTVKLGEKVTLEFGDEKTLGTKCTFSGLIKEKDQEKK